MRLTALLTTFVAVTLILAAASAMGGVPQMISYQGRLTDDQGGPVSGMYSIKFRVYDSSAGGSELWSSDGYVGAPVENGLFHHYIGESRPLPDSLSKYDSLWLGIQIYNEPEEIDPRTRLVSAPYALMAGNANHAVNSDTAAVATISQDLTCTGCISSSHIAADAITSDLIDDGTISFSDINQNGAGEGEVMKLIGGNWIAAADEIGSDAWIDDGTIVRLLSDTDSVGIGTSTPTEKLDVDGNIIITGKATIGSSHTNTGLYAFVAGEGNEASDEHATVSGRQNTASGRRSVVSGGGFNTASGWESVVGGGGVNSASGDSSVIGGGQFNVASGMSSTIGGGRLNSASNDWTVVGGGLANSASQLASTVSGGYDNAASGASATVSGGRYNKARGAYSTVAGGGSPNVADSNSARGDYSAVGGGTRNLVDGDYSSILGGYANTISSTADYSYLFGIASNLTEDSTFMVDMPHIRFGDESNGYELPASDGESGQVMSTDGSGQLSWADVSASGASFGELQYLSIEKEYQAATDGFVLANVWRIDGSATLGVQGYVGPSSPSSRRAYALGDNLVAESIFFPVKQDEHWRVYGTGGYQGSLVIWLPMGSR